MPDIPYFEPFYVGAGNFQAPIVENYVPVYGAAFRRGAFLALTTTGTIYNPLGGADGFGTLVGVPGPTASEVIFGTTASAGKPAATYYVQVAYCDSGGETDESILSQEFVVNVPAGFELTVEVITAGAPSGYDYFNTYVSLFPGYEALAGSTHGSPTATGSALTIVYPLANSKGVTGAATNASASIVGMSINSSAAIFFSGVGGSTGTGEQSLFGATNSLPPLEPAEIFMAPVVKAGFGAIFEMSLVQAFYPNLIASTAGLTLDATSGFYVVDNSQSNKILNIIGQSSGVPSVTGVPGQTGCRVLVQFNSGTI